MPSPEKFVSIPERDGGDWDYSASSSRGVGHQRFQSLRGMEGIGTLMKAVAAAHPPRFQSLRGMEGIGTSGLAGFEIGR